MKKKTIGIAITTLAVFVGLGYYFFFYSPHRKAVNHFEAVASQVKKKNDDLNSTISKAEKLVKKNEEPLEQRTLDNLKTSISEAKKNRRTIPKIKDKTEDIKKQTKILSKKIDYSAEKKAINNNTELYQTSVTQLKQITNPSQSFIEERLKEIDTVTSVQSVTESNDPNKSLNKQGGYTASVYFTDSQVTESVEGNDTVTKGNDAGGNVEVYKTKEEAEKRNDYLSSFDGQGILNPGSHYVYGTIIIRTSRHLTASQQQELTKKIYEKLIEIKDGKSTSQSQKKKEITPNSSNKLQPSTSTEQEQQNNSGSVQPSQQTTAPTKNSTSQSSSDEEIAHGGFGGAWGDYDGGYENGYLNGYEDGVNSVPSSETPEEVWTYEDSIGYKMSIGEYTESSDVSQP